ncbi:MAG: hypothetical protein GW873_00500 [Nitrospirae bacterium]|nr:hypothetical protein [Nitrospirota bacterium]
MKLFQPKKKKGATLMSTQVSEIVYSFVCHAATEAAKGIIEDMDVGNKDAEKKKLEFDLSIAFIVVASFDVEMHAAEDKNLHTAIMDGVCDLYFDDLRKFSQDHIKNSVDAGFFIRDKDEIALFVDQFPPHAKAKVDINNFRCKTTLHTIADLLFNKRFLEYQELWKSDMIKAVNKQPGFIPQMPHKVYEHWSGKSGEESRTFESLMFTTQLFTCFSSFSLALSNQLSEITMRENR